MHSFLLQDWVTIQGDDNGGGVISVAQNSAEYLDLDGYQDVVVWWQVSSASGGTITLDFQTAPEKDETQASGSGFRSLTSINYTHGSAVVQALAANIGSSVNAGKASTPLARWVRWNLTCTATAIWSITFRIFVLGTTYQ